MPLAFDNPDACNGAGPVVTGLLRPDPRLVGVRAAQVPSERPNMLFEAEMQHKLIAPIMEKKLRYTHRLPGAPHGGRLLEAPMR